MPRTGGGTNTNVMRLLDRRQAAAQIGGDRSARLSPLAARTAWSSSTVQIAPALGEGVKVAALRPVNGAVFFTPGVVSVISLACASTLSVRSSELPGGSCTETNMMPRSSVGDEPGRRRGVIHNASPISPA